MRIVLVRHGQSTANKLRIVQGQKDYPLTDLGEEQAKELAHRMLQNKFSINGVYSSDLSRAKRTAEILVEILELDNITFDERLREMHFGIRQGKKVDDITPEEKQHQDRVWVEHDLQFPGGESVNDMKARISEILEEVIASHKEEDTILIVAHGGTLFSILHHILGIFPEGKGWFGNCSYNEIYRDKISDKWQLKILDNKVM